MTCRQENPVLLWNGRALHRELSSPRCDATVIGGFLQLFDCSLNGESSIGFFCPVKNERWVFHCTLNFLSVVQCTRLKDFYFVLAPSKRMWRALHQRGFAQLSIARFCLSRSFPSFSTRQSWRSATVNNITVVPAITAGSLSLLVLTNDRMEGDVL